MSLAPPYEFLDELGRAAIPHDALPSVETLYESAQAAWAIHEFLTMQIAAAVKTVSAKGTPHSVNYEDIGRLLTWVDKIRSACSTVIEEVTVVAVLAHETLPALAEGVEPTIRSMIQSG